MIPPVPPMVSPILVLGSEYLATIFVACITITKKTTVKKSWYFGRSLSLETPFKTSITRKKIRRQHSIENYIVDFYCPSEKLIIELDGGYHNNPIVLKKDDVRDYRLKELGFQIICFENRLVFDDTKSALKTISEYFKNDKSPPPLESG